MVGYPGNKESWELPQEQYSRIYDLFMGGGGFTRSALRNSESAIVYGAEANPIQRAILNNGGSLFLQESLKLARKNAETLKLFIDKSWDGKGSYSEEFPEKRESLGVAWTYLVKMPFDQAMRTGRVGYKAVAAQLLCSTYGYGANIRMSGNGLNVPPNAQKLRGQLPTLPAVIPGIKKISESFEQLEIIGGKNTIALIDPPYVLPAKMKRTHKLLTACYPSHKPYGKETWDLYWDSISKCLRARVGTVIVAGYYSSEMDYGIKALARSYGYEVESIPHKALQQQAIHTHRLIHGGRAQNHNLPAPIDWEWRLKKVQKNVVSLGQLDLWTA